MDAVVQQTDWDAFSCRMAAISKRYLPCKLQQEECGYKNYDIVHIEYSKTLRDLSRRIYSKIHKACINSQPVMNYGSYVRTVSIDDTLHRLIKEYNGRVQIVNLGCGSDLRVTMLFRKYCEVRFVDVDFEESVAVKRNVLTSNSKLREFVDIESEKKGSGRYNVVAGDLRDVKQILELLQTYTVPNIPTIVITECVLCYLGDDVVQQLIKSVTGFYEHGDWISYDPIGGSCENDRFGKIMQTNLRESRQLDMPTLMRYNSKESYTSRFPGECIIRTMWEYYENYVSNEEKTRLKTLQFLDEVEELQIILSHYIILTTKW